MGLTANVYRRAGDDYDCTNGGWSSRAKTVLVVNAEGPVCPTKTLDIPHVLVVPHRTMHVLHVVSVEDAEAKRWTMFGGNFLSCSDSRFGELIGRLLGKEYQYAVSALPIHDRIE